MLLFAAVAHAQAAAPGPTTVILSATQDTLLDNDRPDNNMGAANFAAKVASQYTASFTRIMLVQFDLSTLASTNVVQATLRLHCPPSGWDHSVDAKFLFYAVLQPWAEGTGTGTEGEETKDGATWNSRDGFTPWEGGAIAHNRKPQSPGNFADTPFATLAHAMYEEWLSMWIEVDATEVVRQWVAGQVPNCGVAVCALGLSTNSAYTMFATREFNRDGYAAGQVAPQLVLRLGAP
jgi:hypothetical protein